MPDDIGPLHEDPQVEIDAFAVLKVKPFLIGAGCKATHRILDGQSVVKRGIFESVHAKVDRQPVRGGAGGLFFAGFG